MPSQNEVALLRDQITEEVNRDAEVLGAQLFAGNANAREPDIARVSDQNLQALYREKYLAQDREWLTGEAQRDPQQFMKVAQAIGVVLPQNLPDHVPPVPTLPTPPGEPPAPQPPVMAPPMAVPPAIAPPADPMALQAAIQQALGAPQAPVAAPPGMIPAPVVTGPQPVIAPPLIPPQ